MNDEREKERKNGEMESLLKGVELLLIDKEIGAVVQDDPRAVLPRRALHMPDEAGLKVSLRGQRVLWLCNSDWLSRPRPISVQAVMMLRTGIGDWGCYRCLRV